MSYQDILVFLDDGSTNATRVSTGLHFAKRHDAKLTGVALATMKPRRLRTDSSKVRRRVSQEMAEQLVAEFTTKAEQKDVRSKSIIIAGNADKSTDKMVQYSHNYDLLILRQPNPDQKDYSRLTELSETVLLKSGRPILFMPYIGTDKCPGNRVMITWDGTAAACRAVHNALPLMHNASEVVLVIVENKKTRKNVPEAAINGFVEHLNNHGINLTVRRVLKGSYDIATVILNEVAETATDLLIMGGYGKPSLQEKIFGGVTKSILSSMIVPVLMSH
ncbi:MAG: universal stress protein [Gammaproteobacteria bacterium]|nr:universal stress protein [Gammaproteobacteria bacterium]